MMFGPLSVVSKVIRDPVSSMVSTIEPQIFGVIWTHLGIFRHLFFRGERLPAGWTINGTMRPGITTDNGLRTTDPGLHFILKSCGRTPILNWHAIRDLQRDLRGLETGGHH